ncbi:MAG: hypothetical protein AABW47_03290 [Nanoarchaeota archaeon]
MNLQEGIISTRMPMLSGAPLNLEIKPKTSKKRKAYSDFDKTIIIEDSILKCIKVCFSESPNQLKFVGELVRNYRAYQKSSDVQEVYKLFGGCPVNVLEQVTTSLHINDEWMKLVERLGLLECTILSRNIREFITKYIKEQYLPIEIESIVANYPEIYRGFYTGRIIPTVSNENLARLVKEDMYICGEEEKRILEKSGLSAKSVKERGLFIYEKR